MSTRPNDEFADAFDELADLLEVEEADAFRVMAYRNAAGTLRGLPESVRDWIAEGRDPKQLHGIGDAIAKKIGEIAATGSCKALDEARQRTGGRLIEVLRLPGLGPKRVRLLREQLAVSCLADVEVLARQGRIRDLPGFGKRTEERILETIERRRSKDA